jgi:hypothetical protein
MNHLRRCSPTGGTRQKIKGDEMPDHQQRHVDDRDRVRGAQLPRQRRKADPDGVVIVEDEVGPIRDAAK